MKKILSGLLAVIIVLSCFASMTVGVYAEEASSIVQGNVYKFDAKSSYEYSTADAFGITTAGNTMGSLVLLGDAKDDGIVNGCQTYTVSTGNLSLAYRFNESALKAKETDWHIIEDSSKTIDNIKIDDKIKSGAIIVQSSSDGKKWLTDVTVTNVFKDKQTIKDAFYETSDIQLENGCYYRIVVVYELQRVAGEKKIAFIKTDIKEQQKVAEVYQFFAKNESLADSSSVLDEPRKELASKSVNAGKDTGFSGADAIDIDDPHFGWKLGTFVINGYTRETEHNGKAVYLKNVGDKVTLWFSLAQDINCLNGDDTLSVAEDKDGYDQYFGVNKTDFGHGTLIISYTDYQGKTADPIVYTNFLEANAKTKADTRVRLFEEGDYEITLDYEIKNNPRQVGSISVLPTYTDYKISFSFSIRNGNCMVFPFDVRTGAELSDGDITQDGFKLDTAKSRYLDVNVTRTTLSEAPDGTLVEDVRFDGPAKDGETFDKEGIYHFTVINRYTGEENTKTIYVGMDKYLNAMSEDELTVEDVNKQISEGVVFEEVAQTAKITDEPITTKEINPAAVIGVVVLIAAGVTIAGVIIAKKRRFEGVER